MKIAIHHRKGSFSDRWIAYCEKNNVNYKIVNCYANDIIRQLQDCDALMWHFSHADYRDLNFARQLIYSIELMGIKVFPNYNTCWHFDDKVGQKYLLESIGAPLVPTYVFYNKEEALSWAKMTNYPKVFKLRGGAGSQNVLLVKSYQEAVKLINKAFGKGFKLVDQYAGFRQRLWVLKRDKNISTIIHLAKGIVRLIYPVADMDLLPVQKGYVYFQDYIPDNNFDDRIVVVGNRAFSLRRFVRTNDFRASGSGLFDYNPDKFKPEIVKLSFDISKKLSTQSIAFDFIYGDFGKPLITEISYAYAMGPSYDNCPGYWDEHLNWHNEEVDPQRFMIEDLIKDIH
jgi:glutathione synthase/RimK-type ligase-like ATP-grasp enzyme